MKIAICFSGICRGNVSRNIEHALHHFKGDVFFASWKGRESDIQKEGIESNNIFYVDEPEMHYHPILDVNDVLSPKLKSIKKNMIQKRPGFGDEYYERTLNHTKQILIHKELLNHIPEEYDMIVRMRYDTFLSKKVDISKYLDRSYNHQIAIGFGTRSTRHKNIDILYEIPKLYPSQNSPSTLSQDWGWYIMDPLILHPRRLFSLDRVDLFHSEKKLLVAENGWYQILSQPYGDTHECVYGAAQIEKYLR